MMQGNYYKIISVLILCILLFQPTPDTTSQFINNEKPVVSSQIINLNSVEEINSLINDNNVRLEQVKLNNRKILYHQKKNQIVLMMIKDSVRELQRLMNEKDSLDNLRTPKYYFTRFK